MKKTFTLSCLLLIMGYLCISASSQCVTFYTDSNFQGNVFQLCSSGNVPSQYNDQASSFVVPSGYSVTLYQDYGYGGQAVGPYNQGSYNVPGNFNDQLSSVTISQVQNPSCVTFYTDSDEQGNTFQLCSSGNVPSQYNDQVSSFVVPYGLSVTLYQDYGYGGQAVGPYTQGTYNVPGNFNDQLSSASISKAQPLNPKCVTFYTDSNQQGSPFQLCSSGNVPGQYNDQASSFVVPSGLSVTLYQDGNFGGQSIGPYTQGSYNVPGNFNDQLSSATISQYQPLNPNCVTFYTDSNQQGSPFQLCSSGNVPSQYNDQVSSFVVPSGLSVTLYQDYGYGGQAVGPYSQGTYNVPGNFNDQLSSVTISQAQNPNCVTFYTDSNEQGNVFQLCSSGNVPSQYNDQVSSFIVPSGLSITLYQDYGYGGQAVGPYTQGTYNVPGNFNDQLSSVTISQVRNRNCPTFYTDANLGGNSFQLCSSGDVPSQWNDQVSSFTVPRGYIVRLYADVDYDGQSFGPYSQGTYNVPGRFNDQLSSVYIRRR